VATWDVAVAQQWFDSRESIPTRWAVTSPRSLCSPIERHHAVQYHPTLLRMADIQRSAPRAQVATICVRWLATEPNVSVGESSKHDADTDSHRQCNRWWRWGSQCSTSKRGKDWLDNTCGSIRGCGRGGALTIIDGLPPSLAEFAFSFVSLLSYRDVPPALCHIVNRIIT